MWQRTRVNHSDCSRSRRPDYRPCQLRRKHFKTSKNRPLDDCTDDVYKCIADPPRNNIVLRASEQTPPRRRVKHTKLFQHA